MNKQELRKHYLLLRQNIIDKKKKSLIITKKILQTAMYQNAHTIAMYMNLPSEVETTTLINQALEDGKVVALPRVTEDGLIFYQIKLLDNNLIKSNFGVLEPSPDSSKEIAKDHIDLIIVPGVCFDKYHNRLGFGKGYYDTYLENTNIDTIAICFEEQITKEPIPITDNDIKMKYIITDKNNY